MPSWAGLGSDAVSAFMAGFGIVELAGAFMFAFLIGFVMLKKLITAAGF